MTPNEEARAYIERLSTELKNKHSDELRVLESTKQEHARAFGDEHYTITTWARKHSKLDKLGVIVEFRKYQLLGISTVNAVGFFTSAEGIEDMREDDLWDYGY